MVNKRIRVLLGKNPDTSDGSVRELLEGQDAQFVECYDGIETIRKAVLQRPDLILLDVDLPRMNGYLCSRLLKQDPFFTSTPVVHVAPSGSPIDRFWSRVCRGDHYLTTPASEDTWENILRAKDFSESQRRRVGSHAGLIGELDDNGILRMAAGLLEQDLIRATVLNEINRMDTWDMEPGNLVTSLMTIIQSLYPFGRGASLLISDNHSELYVCGREPSDQTGLDETKDLMIDYLWERHSILLKNNEITSQAAAAPFSEANPSGKSEIYIHTREAGPVHTVLFFENLGIEDLRREEREVLFIALDLVHGVLERKILARKSQELSIIDMATKGYSMAFFMEVLEREISNARRNNYCITLVFLTIANFEDIIANLQVEDRIDLVRIIQKAIMRTMRKTDFIARWKGADFAFLLTHTSLENARNPVVRVQKYILEDVSSRMPLVGRLVPRIGASELNLAGNQTAESFFAAAMPDKTAKMGATPPTVPPATEQDRKR